MLSVNWMDQKSVVIEKHMLSVNWMDQQYVVIEKHMLSVNWMVQPSVHDKPCDIQEQRFMAQFVLHPQQMSIINASVTGCWSIRR
jgi:hypothetical protein